MNAVATVDDRSPWTALSALERVVAGILLAMVVIWTTFQVVEIQALFPPIGPLYALGSLVILAAMTLGRRRWSPALASAWGAMMLIPESIPAVGHLTDWSELYTHFGHYLVIMIFFPLATAMTVLGIVATRQNRHGARDRPAPDWLRLVMVGTVALIAVANAVVIALYAFEIP